MKPSSEKEAMHNLCFSCGWVGRDAVSTGSFRCPHCCKDACKGESFVSCCFMKIDQYTILRKFLYLNKMLFFKEELNLKGIGGGFHKLSFLDLGYFVN